MDVLEGRHVAAMRAVNVISAGDDSAGLVVPPRPGAASVTPGGLAPRPYHRLRVERLVQLFVVCTRYVPRTARRLLAPGDLPPALERVAMQAERCAQTWFAWTDESRIWFVVAEATTVPGLNCERGALRMFFYDADGRFVSWGTWALQSARSWTLCER